MDKRYSDVYTEAYEIINHMEQKEINKIPKNVIDFIRENKNDNYEFKIDEDKNLEEQNLKRDTLVLMALISLNYWCENDEEKEELLRKYSENDKKRERELREKFNPDNLFMKKTGNAFIGEKNSNLPIEVKKPKFFERIINFFKRIFK